MKKELLQLFATPLLITKYEDDISQELKFVEALEYTQQPQNGNFKSRNSYLMDLPELGKIKKFIDNSLEVFSKNILMSDQKLEITQCWTNRNPQGSKHHEHIHPNSIVSGVFYFRIHEKLPPIQFSKAIMGSLKLEPIKWNNLNSETFMLPLVSGELILFPSTLKHSVPVNQCEEARISMSFNTFVRGELGSVDQLTHLDLRRLHGKS